MNNAIRRAEATAANNNDVEAGVYIAASTPAKNVPQDRAAKAVQLPKPKRYPITLPGALLWTDEVHKTSNRDKQKPAVSAINKRAG